jgi:hypothetical protein
MRVPVQTSPAFSAGTPELLFDGPFVQLEVTSDHQRFIATVQKQKNQPDQMNVIVNWFDEVRKLAP